MEKVKKKAQMDIKELELKKEREYKKLQAEMSISNDASNADVNTLLSYRPTALLGGYKLRPEYQVD